LELSGYWHSLREVSRLLWKNRKTFLLLSVIYALFTVTLVGLGSQESYNNLSASLQETSTKIFEGQWGQIGRAGLLFASVASTGLTGTLTDAQQIYTALLFLLVWVTTVWLLRQILAGRKVKLRDGLYNAGAPIFPTILLFVLLLIQMIPLAVVTLGYSAATTSGLIEGGVEAMLFFAAAGSLTILSLYWIIATFIALVIVTLPGTYPMDALRAAGDIVTGRRLKILLRVVWMLLWIAITWAIVLIPVILIDSGLKSVFPAIEWIPIVPITLLCISTVSVVWSATYIYLLYRKVVEYDAAH
jgi:hypothetical protein